jgi:hypothetical protein
MIRLSIPIKTTTTMNSRAHWAVKAKAAKREHTAVAAAWAKERPEIRPILRITLTRVGPRQMDSDQVVTSLKGIRDGVAKKLRIDDGSPLVDWVYRQQHGEYEVRVEVEELRPPPLLVPVD